MNKAVISIPILIALILLALALYWQPSATGSVIATCPDNKCQFPFETTLNCPQDCGKVIPAQPPKEQTFTGRVDCTDNICSPPESYDSNSPNYCAECICDGNEYCEPAYGENSQNCPNDCPAIPQPPAPPEPTIPPTEGIQPTPPSTRTADDLARYFRGKNIF